MTAAVKFEQSEKALAARVDVERMLKRIGCEAIHFIDDIEHCELRLMFQRHGTRVTLPISARTWTGIFLRLRPWTPDNRMTEQHYRENAVRQGLMAISPMLKSWIFGATVAIENGLVPFDRAFLSGVQINNDQTVADVVAKMLPRSSKDASK